MRKNSDNLNQRRQNTVDDGIGKSLKVGPSASDME